MSLQINLTPWNFVDYTTPLGYLPRFEDHPSAHALMMYSIMAYEHYHKEVKQDPIIYEDELWPDTTIEVYENMLKAMRNLYGVEIETMLRYWDVVSPQLAKIGIALPDQCRIGSKIIMPLPKPRIIT